LSGLVQGIPEGKLDVRRGEGFWTITEHVSHLAHVQPMLLERIQRFLKEDHPEFIPFLPAGGEDGPMTPPLLEINIALELFALYREKQLALLNDQDDNAWRKIGTHPEYEVYSLPILARHVLMHDFWHMYRMEELWLTKDAYLTKVV
jgi:hypothetical protein